MTKEEFKVTIHKTIDKDSDFPIAFGEQDEEELAKAIMEKAEPLFKEIERLKNQDERRLEELNDSVVRNLSLRDTIERQEKEISSLVKALEGHRTYIEALENDVKFYHGEVDGLRGDLEISLRFSQQSAIELLDLRKERLELKRQIKYLKGAKDNVFGQLRIDQDKLFVAEEKIKAYESPRHKRIETCGHRTCIVCNEKALEETK